MTGTRSKKQAEEPAGRPSRVAKDVVANKNGYSPDKPAQATKQMTLKEIGYKVLKGPGEAVGGKPTTSICGEVCQNARARGWSGATRTGHGHARTYMAPLHAQPPVAAHHQRCLSNE